MATPSDAPGGASSGGPNAHGSGRGGSRSGAADDASSEHDARVWPPAGQHSEDGGGRDLRVRVLSALVLAPLAIAVAFAQAPIFAGVVAAGGVILAREWTRMSDPEAPDLAFALTAAAAAGATIAASAGLLVLALAWAGGAAALAGATAWRRGRGIDSAFGALYIAVPCALLISVRLSPAPVGAEAVIFLFVCVWGADIGAYAAGRLIGGPRVAARISPNKTWAGLAGGLVLAVCFGMAAAKLMELEFGGVRLVLMSALLGVACLLGDLLESALKRRYGVKDAGALIPGHGGLLDRVDGLMIAAIPMATIVVQAWGT